MYDDYKCVECSAIEAVEDKISTPQGDKCKDCNNKQEI